MKQIKSSNLDSADYDPQTKVLIVKFKNGTSYRYADVPVKIYVEFEETFGGENGKSAGKFFNSYIKHLPCEQVN